MSEIYLEDEKVILRTLCAEDYPYLLPYSLHEADTWNFSPSGAAGAPALEKYIHTALTELKNGLAYPFIVFDKDSQSYAGSSRYYNISQTNRNLEIGFTWYGKAYRGTGLNKHCKYLMLEHAFEKMDMLRVGFKADATNALSVAAMKSVGAIEEGILRQNTLMPSGRMRDTMVLSILQNEWFAHAKSQLKDKL